MSPLPWILRSVHPLRYVTSARVNISFNCVFVRRANGASGGCVGDTDVLKVDDELYQEHVKSPVEDADYVRAYIRKKYSEYILVFVDGGKEHKRGVRGGILNQLPISQSVSQEQQPTLKAGVGIYSASDHLDISEGIRARDDTSSSLAELLAIKVGLKRILTKKEVKNEIKQVVIFTDSLYSIDFLSYKKMKAHRNDVRHRIYTLAGKLRRKGVEKLVLTWIPAHIGFDEHDKADTLADQGKEEPCAELIRVPSPSEYREKEYNDNKWFKEQQLRTDYSRALKFENIPEGEDDLKKLLSILSDNISTFEETQIEGIDRWGPNPRTVFFKPGRYGREILNNYIKKKESSDFRNIEIKESINTKKAFEIDNLEEITDTNLSKEDRTRKEKEQVESLLKELLGDLPSGHDWDIRRRHPWPRTLIVRFITTEAKEMVLNRLQNTIEMFKVEPMYTQLQKARAKMNKEDAENRRNKILFFNVPETGSEDGDRKEVEKVLKKAAALCQFKAPPDIGYIKRIGSDRRFPRILRVQLVKNDDLTRVLKNLLVINSILKYNQKIHVSSDLSYQQRLELRDQTNASQLKKIEDEIIKGLENKNEYLQEREKRKNNIIIKNVESIAKIYGSGADKFTDRELVERLIRMIAPVTGNELKECTIRRHIQEQERSSSSITVTLPSHELKRKIMEGYKENFEKINMKYFDNPEKGLARNSLITLKRDLLPHQLQAEVQLRDQDIERQTSSS